MPELSQEQQQIIVGLVGRDPAAIDRLLHTNQLNVAESNLDPKTHALVNLAALVAIDASTPSYTWRIALALEAGATLDELFGLFVTLAPTIGNARIVSAATKFGEALEFDLSLGGA